MSLKKQLALALAVRDAGFKPVEVNSRPSTDGPCWVATLAHGAIMTGRAKRYLETTLQGRYPAESEARELRRLRDLDVLDLQRKPTITAADVQALERTGRYRVANESFDKCDADAQQALRDDPDYGVRSAVAFFKPMTPFVRQAATPA